MKPAKKYLVIICDGMSDFPMDSLGGKTVLEYAETPNMDYLASHGVSGQAITVPEGMQPGSDIANLSIFGYNPKVYFSGRAPLEAINMGIELGDSDAAFRCNIVTLRDGVMHDFCADHISTEFATLVIDAFNKEFSWAGIELYPGVSYRNLLVWRNYPHQAITSATPPHDIQGKPYDGYLPHGDGSELFREIMTRSMDFMANSAVIREARNRMKGDPVSFWIWGGGRRPAITPYRERYGLAGITISAVDLIHGIGRAAGLVPVRVPGATGYIDTNYDGKAAAALQALRDGSDIAFVHLESPDESGHEGSLEHKLMSIRDIDKKIVGALRTGMEESFEDYSILLLPDHATPISIRTHVADPVPFVLYSKSGVKPRGTYGPVNAYSEREAATTGLFVDDASNLVGHMIAGEI